MLKILEAILKTIPIAAAFSYWGISKDVSAGLASIVIAIIIYFSVELFKKRKIIMQNKKTAIDLKPYFDYLKVKQARDLFIQTQGQSYSPTYEDDSSNSTKFIVKKALIPWFLNIAFNEKKEDDKFYLILADSGMGKTTFLINLYINFHLKYGKKYKIELIPFGDDRIIKKLEILSKNQLEAKNTILLLDAFDEYKGLLPPENPDGLSEENHFRKLLDEIIELTRDFREVIITSRTQYFPGQEDSTYELKIPRFDDAGFYKLVKIYLSPFDSKEIGYYLNKKYGVLKFWNRSKKKNAKNIIASSAKLMVRPMLLAYIDYFVDSKNTFKTTYQIYSIIIDKWIEREAKKRKHQSTTRERFKEDLNEFSHKIALLMYNNLILNSTLSIDKETALQLCKRENLMLQDYEVTGQSLLTRDINGDWKFAHKSIFEFLLAKHASVNFCFFKELAKNDFVGIDMTRTFYQEVSDYIFVKGGVLKTKIKNEIISNFWICKYLVTQKLWREIMKNDPISLEFKGKDNNPVERVNWYNAIEFCNRLSEKYNLQAYYTIEKEIIDLKNQNQDDKLKYIVTINENAKGFRLLTELEWEYSARGGNKSKFYEYAGSNTIDEVAWYDQNSNESTHPVGQKKANELGIYDMSGNVYEWCYDWYESLSKKIEDINVGSGMFRILRGGSWESNGKQCSLSESHFLTPNYHYHNTGFRVAINL